MINVLFYFDSPNISMSGQNDEDGGEGDLTEVGITTKEKVRTKRPKQYRVLLLNDDYTPMEFVVSILEEFFNKSEDDAVRIMLQVHHKGAGECGTYSFEIAETKVMQVMDAARLNLHPLQCVMEKA